MTNTMHVARAPWGAEKAFAIRAEKEGDISVVNEVFECDTYKVAEMTTAPKIVFDIGGHIGTFTCALKSRFPDVRVWIIEPHPRSVELIRENVAEYGDAVTVIQGAVSYKRGDRLADGVRATGGGFMTTPDVFGGKPEDNQREYRLLEEPVTTYTIEELLELAGVESVDLVKWDCEGGEIDAFENMTDAAAARLGDFVGEFHYAGGYNGFREIAERRFPDYRFEGRQHEIDDKRHIGWFRAFKQGE